jgi:hypothetical protein
MTFRSQRKRQKQDLHFLNKEGILRFYICMAQRRQTMTNKDHYGAPYRERATGLPANSGPQSRR